MRGHGRVDRVFVDEVTQLGAVLFVSLCWTLCVCVLIEIKLTPWLYLFYTLYYVKLILAFLGNYLTQSSMIIKKKNLIFANYFPHWTTLLCFFSPARECPREVLCLE